MIFLQFAIDIWQMLWYYIEALPSGSAKLCRTEKKFAEKRKKFLTKRDWCGRVNKLTACGGSGVPCKLNNADEQEHLGQLMDCLSDVKSKLTANENS